MLEWLGRPLTRRRTRLEDDDVTARLQRHFEVLADAAAAPGQMWWPTLDSILALPATTDCPPSERVEGE